MFRNGFGRPGVNRKLCSSSHSDTKPLNGGRPALANTPTRAAHAVHGMKRIRPPSWPEIALTRRVEHGTRSEEQQALERRMARDLIEKCRQRQRGQRVHAVRAKQDRQPHADEHQADVVDRRVRKQPLHIGLDGAEHDPEQGSEEPECKHGAAHHHSWTCSRSNTVRSTP